MTKAASSLVSSSAAAGLVFVLTEKKEARLELTVLMCKGRDHTNPALIRREREKKYKIK